MPTIKDVARRAGVSVSTVSRVLNHHPYVTDDLVHRVMDSIEELNYRPSRVAQRLRSINSQLVGVIFSDITNPFYIHTLRGIENIFSQQGMSVLISNADADQDLETSFIQLMITEGIAGLIVAPTREESQAITNAVHEGLPVVVIDRQMKNIDVDTVLVDNFRGSLVAIEHLIANGHEAPAARCSPATF